MGERVVVVYAAAVLDGFEDSRIVVFQVREMGGKSGDLPYGYWTSVECKSRSPVPTGRIGKDEVDKEVVRGFR